VAGQLDQATTTILFGNEDLVDLVRPGGRIHMGYWFDDRQCHGVQFDYLRLATRSDTFQLTSAGDPILARPFFNVEPGFEGQDAELVAFPGLLEGRIDVDAESTVESVGVLYRRMMCRWRGHQTDFVVGWRYSRLDDELTISDTKTAIGAGGAIALGTTVEEIDRFTAQNDFHGIEVGLINQWNHCDWMLELTAKVALGNMQSDYAIDGSTTVTVPVPGGDPAVAVTPAGLLAQSTNIGVYTNDEFAVIPELGVLFGYQVARNVRVTAGYTVIYWSRVTRAGDGIDTQLNLSQLDPAGLVGPERPTFTQTDSSLWMHGLNLGLDVQF
jgi:hypothetical protein